MACSCIQDYFDFDLTYHDCKTLYYRDRSKWAVGPHFLPPDTYEIQIVVQGGAAHHILVEANTTTRILPSDLGYGSCFPGGIITVSVESCGTTYTRIAGVLCQEECGLQKAVSKLRPDDEGYPKVLKIKDLLDRAYTAIRRQNSQQATNLLHIVRQELKKINCEPCGCA